MNLLNPFILSPSVPEVPSVFEDARAVFELRKHFNWDAAILRVRRSNDDALAYVFFNGPSAQDTITLSSYISTTSAAVPDATTLGTWLGANDAFVSEWYLQRSSGIADGSNKLTQAITGYQPKFATAGVIEVYNSKAALLFSSNFLKGAGFSETAYTNNFTIITVSRHTNDTTFGGIIQLCNTASQLFTVTNDNSTGKKINYQRGGNNILYSTEYNSQQNTFNQKLLSVVHNATNNIAYYNNSLQQTTAHNGDSYNNDDFIVGKHSGSSFYLSGVVQAVILFPSDKTLDLAAIHAEINDYYSIY